MSKNTILLALILFVTLIFTTCEKGDPVIPNEEELITTLTYTLSPSGGGAVINLSFKDLDGDGGAEPVIKGGTLIAGESYTGTLELANEAETPDVDITQEIRDEDEEHQFFFQSSIDDLTIEYTDQDSDGHPIGLSTTVTTGAEASGTLTIILRHEPDKAATGVSDGIITNAGGETDLEVTFPIDVR